MPNDGYCEIADLGGCWKTHSTSSARRTYPCSAASTSSPPHLVPTIPLLADHGHELHARGAGIGGRPPQAGPPLQQGQVIVTKRFDPIAVEWYSQQTTLTWEKALAYGEVVSDHAEELANGEDVEELDAFLS